MSDVQWCYYQPKATTLKCVLVRMVALVLIPEYSPLNHFPSPQLITSRRQPIFMNTFTPYACFTSPSSHNHPKCKVTISKILHTLCLTANDTLVFYHLSTISSMSKMLHILCLTFHYHSSSSISLLSSNNAHDPCDCTCTLQITSYLMPFTYNRWS